MSNRRWVVAGLLLLATTINYVDRQAIAVAAPVISREFGFSAQDYSWIVFWFLLAYALMQAVAGRIVDRVGTRRGFAVAIVGWSIASMLHALGRGVPSFSACRFLLGTFEAANYPAALKAVAEWFPRSERSTAVGIVNVGPGLGAILAPPLVAGLIVSFGWRVAFVVTGALGLVWLVPWLALSPPPPTSVEAGPARPWRRLLGERDMWGLMLSRFVSDGAFYFFVFWLPKYLADVRGFGIGRIGLFAWIPFLAADLGSVAGGLAGTALSRRGLSLDVARKIPIWAGAILVPAALLAADAPSPYAALAWIAVAMFGIQVKCSALFTVPADLYPAREVALAWGLSGAAGSLGGMAFTPLVGFLVDRFSYHPVFWIVSGMHLVSAAIVMGLIPRIGPRAT